MAVITQPFDVTAAAGSAAGAAGTEFASTASSSVVSIVNTSPAPDSDLEYKVGDGAWIKLGRSEGAEVKVNLAARKLYFRRSATGGGPPTAEVSILTDDEGIDNLNGLTLPKWRAAQGKVRLGTATARLAIVGSSTVVGYQGGGSAPGLRSQNLVSNLAKMLNDDWLPTTAGSIFGGGFSNMATLKTHDTRVVSGSGWTHSTTDNPIGGFSFLATNTTDLLQFTPETPYTVAFIYYVRTATSGTFTASTDGGVTPLATGGSGAEGISSIQVSVPLGTPTLTIKATALGTGVNILAIRTYNTGQRPIEVFQWGVSGGTVENFLRTGKGWSAYESIELYKPDLTLFVVASNVWTSSQPIDTFKSQMNAFISRVKTWGDAGIVTGVPTDAAATPLAKQQTYVDAAREIAVQHGIPFVDNWRRFGTYEQQANPNGMMSDTGHMSTLGYADFTLPIYRLVTEL